MPDKKPPKGLTDTHCHLDMSHFAEDLPEVIDRAISAGVGTMITIGSDATSSATAVELAERYESVYASVGIHPHDSSGFTPDAAEKLRQWAKHPRVVAIGETGLDFHYDYSPRDVQRDVFSAHLDIAIQTGLPAIVHSREAIEETLAILRESGIKQGVMHFFSGSPEEAEEVMKMGLHISLAGPVTFKNARELRRVAEMVPDEMLLIETDAPYLTPEPLRGKRNEPAFVVHTAAEVARIRGISVEDLARITTLNAVRLFGTGDVEGTGKVAYRIRQSLYLNITNRCTNECSFCVRFHSDFVKGHNLRLDAEPSVQEVKAAIGDPSAYKEIVFCGYGEPTLRLDLIKDVAKWVKEHGGRVRINTNGHGNLIHGRNIVPELKGLVDAVSVSLDAHDEETYNRLCAPSFEGAFGAVVDFIRLAAATIPQVQATIVEAPGVDVDACRRLCKDLGATLRVRTLHVVG